LSPKNDKKGSSRLIEGFVILLAFQLAGTIISDKLQIPIPGNVLGLGFITISLIAGIVKLEWVDEAATLLVNNLALFLIPAGVGIMEYFDLIAKEWLPISLSVILSTLAVLLVTAKVTEALQNKGSDDER